jgi:hypothetical protein
MRMHALTEGDVLVGPDRRWWQIRNGAPVPVAADERPWGWTTVTMAGRVERRPPPRPPSPAERAVAGFPTPAARHANPPAASPPAPAARPYARSATTRPAAPGRG